METPPRQKSPLTIGKENLAKSTLTRRVRQNIAEIFNENFIIGEVHDHVSPKRFLIENMSKLAQNGYKVLFLAY